MIESKAEQAATTAADLTRRKIRPEMRDQVYHAIVGLCNMLESTGKYLGSGRDLAIDLSGLVVGDTKTQDALSRAEQSVKAAKAERKTPTE